MGQTFCGTDEYGLEANIPYIAIEITPEQAKSLEGRTPVLYEIDGKKAFSIKDKKGNQLPDKVMIFVLFKERGH